MNINEIMEKYTAGEADLEKTNAALARARAGFRLEPGRNELTEEDRRKTVVGYYPEQAGGYGLLFTGTGSPDKVHVENGRLDFAVNQVQADGTTNSYAEMVICGKVYEVKGDALAERSAPGEAPAVRRDVDLSRRTDLAGRQAEQRTRMGRFCVTYDADGYAVKATRV